MSTAPNWPTLYRFEDYIEAAAKEILEESDIANVYIERHAGGPDDTDKRVYPLVSIQFQSTGATEHYGVGEPNDTYPHGEVLLDAWQGQLVYRIETRRGKDSSNTHALIRSTLRWRMQDVSQWTEELLPYHHMARIIEGGTSPEIQDENGIDSSIISFATQIRIREGAWPLTIPTPAAGEYYWQTAAIAGGVGTVAWTGGVDTATGGPSNYEAGLRAGAITFRNLTGSLDGLLLGRFYAVNGTTSAKTFNIVADFDKSIYDSESAVLSANGYSDADLVQLSIAGAPLTLATAGPPFERWVIDGASPHPIIVPANSVSALCVFQASVPTAAPIAHIAALRGLITLTKV